ncbi:MAG TPA: carboxypeptidase-like regulatory domain-containing protein [Planctomycetota bacterium]
MDSATHRWILAALAAALLVGLLLAPWSGGEPQPTVAEEAPVAAPLEAEPVREVAEVVIREVAPESELAEPSRLPAAPHAERVAAAGELKGRVLFETRSPAAGASVRIGATETKAGPDGSFALPRDKVGSADDLVATLTGYEPAVIESVAQSEAFRSDRVLEVVLPGMAWSIDGFLLDMNGAPCEGWKLELHRGTDCGQISFPNVLAEDLAAGARVQAVDPRAAPAGAAQAVNPNMQTIGTDGAFHIGGLRRGRQYVLRAWNERTLRTVFSDPIPAGAARYVFRVGAADNRERVWGRAVDRSGAPIADVRVRLTMRVHEVPGRTSYQTGAHVRTGGDGTFEFKDVPRENLLLRFDHRDIDSYYHDLLAEDPGADLRIQLACLCRFRYEALPGAAAARSLRVLDANEKGLRITRQIGENSTESRTWYEIASGRSPDLMVSDAAAWLSLQFGDGSEKRVPMQLLRGQVTIFN